MCTGQEGGDRCSCRCRGVQHGARPSADTCLTTTLDVSFSNPLWLLSFLHTFSRIRWYFQYGLRYPVKSRGTLGVPGPYPTVHHFVTEIRTYVHISGTKLCIMGYVWCIWGFMRWAYASSPEDLEKSPPSYEHMFTVGQSLYDLIGTPSALLSMWL